VGLTGLARRSWGKWVEKDAWMVPCDVCEWQRVSCLIWVCERFLWWRLLAQRGGTQSAELASRSADPWAQKQIIAFLPISW
jgi:hypothetical protein